MLVCLAYSYHLASIKPSYVLIHFSLSLFPALLRDGWRAKNVIFRLYNVVSFFIVYNVMTHRFLIHIFWFSVVITLLLVEWFFYHQVILLSLVIFFDLKFTFGMFFPQFLPLQDPLSVFNSENKGCHVPPLEGNGSSESHSISTDNMLAGKGSTTLGCLLIALGWAGKEWMTRLPTHSPLTLIQQAIFYHTSGRQRNRLPALCPLTLQWNRKAPTWDACCCPANGKSPGVWLPLCWCCSWDRKVSSWGICCRWIRESVETKSAVRKCLPGLPELMVRNRCLYSPLSSHWQHRVWVG